MSFWSGVHDFVSDIEPGSWADWVGGLGTIGALLWAVAAFGREERRRDRGQAELVLAAVSKMPATNNQGLDMSVTVSNKSEFPIYDLAVVVRKTKAEIKRERRVETDEYRLMRQNHPYMESPAAWRKLRLRMLRRFTQASYKYERHIHLEVSPGRFVNFEYFEPFVQKLPLYIVFKDSQGRDWARSITAGKYVSPKFVRRVAPLPR